MKALRIRNPIDWSSPSTLKVWVILGLLTVALVVGGHFLGDRYGLLVGFILGLSLNSLVFLYSDIRLSDLFPATELEGQDPWGALRMLKALATRAGVPSPTLHVIKAKTPIAYSAGLLNSRTYVFVSEELVKRFSSDELRAVLALEVAKLKLQHTSAGTAASALAGLVLVVAALIDNSLFLQLFRKRSPGQIRPMALLVSPLVAMIVRGAISRRAVLEADRLAAEWTGSSELVARTIWKLDSYSKTLPLDINMAEAHLFTVSPLGRYRWCGFAQVQPSVQVRSRALMGRFPL